MKKALASIGLTIGILFGGMVAAAPAQAYTYSNCYWALNGDYWCYKSNCTAIEEMHGCYNTWWVWRVWWRA